MKSQLIALLVVLAIVVSAEASSKRSANILNGTLANTGQFPFMATLNVCGSLCGGFILSAYHIGTAAHCFDNNTVASCIRVQVGTNDKSGSAGQVVNASTFATNPNYDNQTNLNDAAVITLLTPLTIDNVNVQIATLATSASQLPANGSTVYVAGWGVTTVNGSDSQILQYVDLPYINLAQCNTTYTNNNFSALVAGKQICAGGVYGRDSCQGDSGGPLFIANNAVNSTLVNATIIGIVSFGDSCGQDGIPGVYADVPDFAYAYFQSVINSSTSVAPSTLAASVNASSVAGSSVAGSSVAGSSVVASVAASSVAGSSVVASVAGSSAVAASSVAGSSAVAASSVAGSSQVAASSVAGSSGVAASSVAGSSQVVAASSGAGSKTSSISQSKTPSESKPVTAVSSATGTAASAAATPSITTSKVKAAKTKTGLAAITCRSDCLKTFRSCKKTTRRLRLCKKAKKQCVSGCGVVNPNK